MDESGYGEPAEYGSRRKGKKGKRAVRGKIGREPTLGAHCIRFWWLHLIVIATVILTVLLPLLYVGYPRMAQQYVNVSTLAIKSMAILEPAPDSFQLQLSEVIGYKSNAHPTLGAFNASVSMTGGSVPFAILQVPQIEMLDGAEAKVDRRVVVSDPDAFTAFAVALLMKEKVDLEISGKPGLKLGSLPETRVTYNKTVTVSGLNSLTGFNITSFNFTTTPKDDGTNDMAGMIFIPNPSVLSLHLGNVTFNLYAENQLIGTCWLQNVVIVPGDNNIPMTATVNETSMLSYMIGPDSKYKNGIIPIDIIGNSSVYNGQKLPYFTMALALNKLRVELNILAAV